MLGDQEADLAPAYVAAALPELTPRGIGLDPLHVVGSLDGDDASCLAIQDGGAADPLQLLDPVRRSVNAQALGRRAGFGAVDDRLRRVDAAVDAPADGAGVALPIAEDRDRMLVPEEIHAFGACGEWIEIRDSQAFDPDVVRLGDKPHHGDVRLLRGLLLDPSKLNPVAPIVGVEDPSRQTALEVVVRSECKAFGAAEESGPETELQDTGVVRVQPEVDSERRALHQRVGVVKGEHGRLS